LKENPEIMKRLFLILLLFSCNNEETLIIEPVDESFHLHGGDFKEWEQIVFITIEGSDSTIRNVLSVNYIFRHDNVFIVSPHLDELGSWELNGTKLMLGINNLSEYIIILLEEKKLIMELHNTGEVVGHSYQEWVPID